MTPINLEDIVFIALVSLLYGQRLGSYAQGVGGLRRKYKIEPPSLDGPDEFIRGFRAQQNILEFTPLFMISLWMSGLFFHQIPAALTGLVYIYAREKYFHAYIEAAKARVSPFYLSVRCLWVFLGMAGIGITKTILSSYGLM